ncbi:hypothetical protein BB558_006113 [Smittium angustum]|uniref:Uncharacterized protein n=1 Tax=Smittium angustum TaxID=133377 RepID=A0A2U1IYQ2_SMIAN|nr:hypothetical protein BB558_006113 [Smittium angustum]
MLNDLCFEILEKIFVLAQNPCLSTVNKKFYSIANTTYIQLEYITCNVSNHVNSLKIQSESSTNRKVIDTDYEASRKIISMLDKYPKLGDKLEIYERLILRGRFVDSCFAKYAVDKALKYKWIDLMEMILSTFKLEPVFDENKYTDIMSRIISISISDHEKTKYKITSFLSSIDIYYLATNRDFIRDEFVECLKLLINLKNKGVSHNYLIDKIQNQVKMQGKEKVCILFDHKKLFDISSEGNSIPLSLLGLLSIEYKNMLLEAIKHSQKLVIDFLLGEEYFAKFKENKGLILPLKEYQDEKHRYFYTSISFGSDDVFSQIIEHFGVNPNECYVILKKVQRFWNWKSIEKLLSFALKPKNTPDEILVYASNGSRFVSKTEVETNLGVWGDDLDITSSRSNFSSRRKADKKALKLVQLCLENGATISQSFYSPVKKAVSDHMLHLTRHYISVLSESGLTLSDAINNKISDIGFRTCDLEFVKLLINSGIKPTINQGAPLIFACSKGRIGIVKLLAFEIAMRRLEINHPGSYSLITSDGTVSHENCMDSFKANSYVLKTDNFMKGLYKECLKVANKNEGDIIIILSEFGYSD